MKPICINCFYYCYDAILRANRGLDPYDYSRSFCGLHGCAEIENPREVQTVDRLNGGVNEEYPGCRCGFFPKKDNKPIQLALEI